MQEPVASLNRSEFGYSAWVRDHHTSIPQPLETDDDVDEDSSVKVAPVGGQRTISWWWDDDHHTSIDGLVSFCKEHDLKYHEDDLFNGTMDIIKHLDQIAQEFITEFPAM